MEDIKLAVVALEPEEDAVITAKSMPGLTGNGTTDLNCGGCGAILAKSLDVEAIDRSFNTKRRLLLECVCGAHNLIHEAKADEIPPTD